MGRAGRCCMYLVGPRGVALLCYECGYRVAYLSMVRLPIPTAMEVA
jgi:hypothetical protein